MWNSVCDVMPTIAEDSISQRSSQFSGEDANFEQLMVSMLDERDKLMDSLRESQERLQEAEARLQDVEKERDALNRQINASVPQEFSQLTKELSAARESILEREEEISELKAERNNTRLLLEHLECLVSRHERSLRMTVVKRQAAAQSGVSSEVEVLKALKSLFEHHKALDEKVRERLRVALERNTSLEEELARTKDELQQYKLGGYPASLKPSEDKPKENGQLDEQQQQQQLQNKNEEVNQLNETHQEEPSKRVDIVDDVNASCPEKTTKEDVERLSNGDATEDFKDLGLKDSRDSKESLARSAELQATLEKQNSEIATWQRRVGELSSRVAELEETLSKTQKEFMKTQEANGKLQRDLRENVAQKEDQEERIATLEKRYLNAQRESTSVHDLNEKLEQELKHKEDQLKLQEKRIAAIQEKLELAEQKLAQYAKLPEMEEQLKQRMEALTQVRRPNQICDTLNKQAQEKHGSAEDRIQRLETQLEEKNGEVMRLNQRLKMNEEHNSRLSNTVDKLLSESNERLQVHLKERMHALEEKNTLTQELEKMRKIAEDLQNEKSEIMKELSKARLEIDNVKRQMLQQEIAFNIQQTDALTRSLSPNAVTLVEPSSSSRSASHSSFDTHSLPRRAASKRIIDDDSAKTRYLLQSYVARTLAEQEWEKLQQAHVLANVQQAFDVSSDAEVDGDNESLFSSAADMISPSGHTDAQTLAMMLQEQLDAINIEIRLIQEEKQSTEARAEELESRVGSLEHMNLLTRGRSHDRASPPLSGRSTPKSHHSPNRDYLHKYHTAPASMSPAHLHQYASSLASPGQLSESLPASQLQLSGEELHSVNERDGMVGMSSGMSMNNDTPSPSTARSIRLERVVQALAHSQEELRRRTGHTGFPNAGYPPHSRHGHHNNGTLNCGTPPSPLSSRHSSQDSLHKNNYISMSAGQGMGHPVGLPLGQLSSSHLQMQASGMSPATAAAVAAAQKKKGIKSSLGRFFSKKDKIKSKDNSMAAEMGGFGGASTPADPDYGESVTVVGTQLSSSKTDFDRRKKKSMLDSSRHELLGEAMKAGTPFGLWNGPTIVAWLELWVGMPAWYVAACRANVKSGAIMSALSDTEIQREIGISNPLHRLKLRLAIQEMVSLTSPSAPKTSRTTLAFGDMNHEWIGNVWLPSLGLPQYRHQLEERRRMAESANADVIVWSNDRVIRWVQSIGLKEYGNNLLESGVHGALIALDDSFDATSFALALQIPTQNTQARQILEVEFSNLLTTATERHPEESMSLKS
ncbi:hypothetical protein G9C98_008127 [Cotesia typhae]|uniref:SAM domain-containing protein n=1 Tax=Cotesia typhae TaxID=2053667 RepID=A0A8J5VBI6_9HYME|nr:hypothetical protein G9C98_008127 [Cotesia typhae]